MSDSPWPAFGYQCSSKRRWKWKWAQLWLGGLCFSYATPKMFCTEGTDLFAQHVCSRSRFCWRCHVAFTSFATTKRLWWLPPRFQDAPRWMKSSLYCSILWNSSCCFYPKWIEVNGISGSFVAESGDSTVRLLNETGYYRVYLSLPVWLLFVGAFHPSGWIWPAAWSLNDRWLYLRVCYGRRPFSSKICRCSMLFIQKCDLPQLCDKPPQRV